MTHFGHSINKCYKMKFELHRSGRARSTRGQASEDWALYKSNPYRLSLGDFSRDLYVTWAKLAFLAGNVFAWGLLFPWANLSR